VLRHSEAWDVIPKAYSLLKHLGNIFGESDLRAFAGRASCGKRGVLAGAVAVTRGRQKSVNFAGTCIKGEASDLSARIVAASLVLSSSAIAPLVTS